MRRMREAKSSRSILFSKETPGKWMLLPVMLIAVAAAVGCSSSGGASSGPVSQIAPVAGRSGQSATTGTAFALPLAVMVEDGSNNPVRGAAVTFTAPTAGESGTFANGSTTETDNSDGSGVASSSAFTANGIAGGPYTVTATAAGVASAVSFLLFNNAAETVTVSGGSPQSAKIDTQFSATLQVVVATGANLMGGVTVTFTAPGSGASGLFATSPPSATAMAVTDTSGVAVAPLFTANSTAGAYTVSAQVSGVAKAASFSLNNTAATTSTLAAGNYVFYLSGTDAPASGTNTPGSFYCVAGVFTVDSNGAITGGEQTLSDFDFFSASDGISNGTISPGDNGSLIITLYTTDPHIGPGTGVEVFDASPVNAQKALLTEFDTWATSSGELDLQNPTVLLCPAASISPCGYAFYTSGTDFAGKPITIGGVIKMDSPGGISGAGSIFDANDNGGGSQYAGQSFTASTFSVPDSRGFMNFQLQSGSGLLANAANVGMFFYGYVIDANHIRLIEDWKNDNLRSTTGGIALGQTGTGNFSNASLSGSSYVVGLNGSHKDTGPLQVAGLFTGNSNLTMGGAINFNDLSKTGTQSPLTINGGTYAVDSTGRATMTGVAVSGSPIILNLQLYLTGDGNALAMTLDSTDILAGFGFQQIGGGSFTAASLSGTYSANITGVDLANKDELDALGSFTATGSASLTGGVDLNWIFNAGPVTGVPVSGTFVANADGVFTGTITGLDVTTKSNADAFSYYLIDNKRIVAIETDDNQMGLGFFELQQ